ncbi:MAG: Stk1 family PASTA domain-containing Ser/Thr kinase [Candidatus Nanopelagicales bacterium]
MSEDVRRLGDRYEIGEVIGRGGMAEVHEGRDLRLGRRVAIKILRPDLARDPSFQARFRREAQSAASLNHPNVVAVYDTGEDVLADSPDATGAVVPFIVMEYVDGMTLRQLMSSGRRLLPERALEITGGTLAALDYSHRHGIVHRDIKPANVMLTRGGEVKVMDFGIARALADSGQTMTQQSAVLGTAHYLSPEQARGEVVDSRSDLYSTGCLLYELLAGRPPFTGESPVSIAYQHVSEAPVPPSQFDPAVTPQIDAIVLRSLAKNPEDRYQSAAEMRADVERAIAGLPVTAPVPVVAQETAVMAPVGAAAAYAATEEKKSQRSPAFWILLTLGVIAAGIAAVLVGRAIFGTPPVEKVNVPDLAGLTIAEASSALQKEGLILGTQTPQASEDKPKDTIISQNPVKGGQVDKGSAVDVTVSTGKDQAIVPTLTGLTSVDAARAALVDAGLTLGKVDEKSSDKPQGVVISQNPPSQETVDAGTPVDIVVSNGKVKVPNVVGSSEAQAQSDLRNAGFDVEVIQLETSNQPEGTVLAQSPQAGTVAVRGTLVTITVAKAPPPPTESPTPPPSDTPTPSVSPTP